MSHVSYGGNRIIPAPFVSLQRVYQRTADNTLISSQWQGTINGTVVAYKGSPNSSGVFWTLGGFPPDETLTDPQFLGAMIRKQEALASLFSVDGKSLEFQSEDGTFPLKCFPIITGITFQEGNWYYENKYTINFECPKLIGTIDDGSPTDFLADAQESWQIETEQTPQGVNAIEQRIYRVTHNVSATGKSYPGNGVTAIMAAKNWVQPKLGFSGTDANSSIVGVTGTPYNYVRTENTGKYDGQYSVSETWVIAPGPATEEFTVDTKTSLETSLTTVSINGTITGLETAGTTGTPTVTVTKYANATTEWATVKTEIFARAAAYSEISSLNITPVNTSVAYNPVNGVISYSYEYNNRPSNLITRAKSEVITIQDSLNTNIVAIIPVLGRVVGPVLQNINTSRERTRTLNVEVVLDGIPSNSLTNPLIGLLSSLISQANPANSFGAGQVYLVENNYSWEPKSNRGSITQTWVYEI
jgi:hypothetical protein